MPTVFKPIKRKGRKPRISTFYRPKRNLRDIKAALDEVLEKLRNPHFLTEEEEKRLKKKGWNLIKRLEKAQAEEKEEKEASDQKTSKRIERLRRMEENPSRKALCRASKQGFKNAVRRRKPDSDGKSVIAVQGGFCDGHGKQDRRKKDD